jgi:hypothetical protein
MIFNTRYTSSLLLLLVLAACKKETAPAPTNLDENYLVVKDNPNDPVDHQIFQFYQSTGIPCFYNDTASKKQVGVSNTGVPQYAVQLLTLNYSPLGSTKSGVLPTRHRQKIPAILTMLQAELIPKVPVDIFIPSILFVDSFWFELPANFADPFNGWDACHGFNTVAVVCRDVAAMNAEEKKVYMASILAGIAAKKILNTQRPKLQKDFYSISRNLAMPEFQMDVYESYPIEFILPVIPEPEHFGFIRYLPYLIKFDDFEMLYTVTPREEDDLRMFLMATLYYTTEAFNTLYASHPVMKEKFRIMKEIAIASGFQLPG